MDYSSYDTVSAEPRKSNLGRNLAVGAGAMAAAGAAFALKKPAGKLFSSMKNIGRPIAKPMAGARVGAGSLDVAPIASGKAYGGSRIMRRRVAPRVGANAAMARSSSGFTGKW